MHLAASMLKNQTPNLAYLNSNASKYSLPFEFQGLIYQNAKKNEEKRLAQINSDINLSIPTKCRSYFIIFVISFICERKTFKVRCRVNGAPKNGAPTKGALKKGHQPKGHQDRRGTAKGAPPKGHQTKGAVPKGHRQRGTIQRGTVKGALPKGHRQRGTIQRGTEKGAPRTKGAPPKRHYSRVTKKGLL